MNYYIIMTLKDKFFVIYLRINIYKYMNIFRKNLNHIHFKKLIKKVLK